MLPDRDLRGDFRGLFEGTFAGVEAELEKWGTGVYLNEIQQLEQRSVRGILGEP